MNKGYFVTGRFRVQYVEYLIYNENFKNKIK